MAVEADSPTAAAPAATSDDVVVPRRTHRVRSAILLVFAAWNVWVWTTRAANMVETRQDWSAAFVTVHLVLFAGGLGGAVVLAVVGIRMWRESRDRAR